jgi:hypothetical protein
MFLIYSGILLLSAATLLFEINLTRIFSVAQWYHFAFMVVSLALFGFGASGSFLSLFPRLLTKNLRNFLATCAAVFSVMCLASYLVINNLPFDSYRVSWEPHQILYLAVYYICLAIPFFFTGLALGAALSVMPSYSGRLYGSNMIGSGLGCLLVLVSPSLFGVGGTVVLAALLGMLGAILFSLPRFKPLLGISIAGVLALVILLVTLPPALEIKISPYKSLSQVLLPSQARRIWTEWNAFSRVDVIESNSIHMAPGLSLKYSHELPPQLGITLDGENLNPINQIEASQAYFTEYLPSALLYQFSSQPRVLILEPCGGLDLLTALHHQSSSATVVISNPLIIEAIEKFTGEPLLDSPQVNLFVEGARSYLRRSSEKFDIVQISLTDNFRVVAAGVYSLSENYLYTTEAFKEYYRHLAPGGILSITRWLQVPPSEDIRLISLAIHALEQSGVAHPEQHVAAIRTLQTLTLLIKESPFTSQDTTLLKNFCDDMGFDTVYFPGITADDLNRYNILPGEYYYEAFTNIMSDSEREAFLADYPYDISPTTDDRPFFFHFFKWGQVSEIWQSLGKTWQPFGGAGYLIIVALLVFSVLLSAIFILLPLRYRPQEKQSQTYIPGVRWQLFIYFAMLGFGFLFIEIPLMQKFILFLDQPTYAFALVLFTIFVFSGMGSMLSARVGRALPVVILALSLLSFLYPLFLNHLFRMWLGQSLQLRLLAAIGALAPISFLMGIPFPSGIRLLEVLSPGLIPWAWGINGCISVIASILSLMIALWVGFSWVLLATGAAYLVAAGVSIYWIKRINILSSG